MAKLKNPVSLSKNIFSATNIFMHIFNMLYVSMYVGSQTAVHASDSRNTDKKHCFKTIT